MIKIYQKIIDSDNGDCMQASVASLFEDDYNNVPSFIKHDNWFELFCKYVESKGYYFDGMLHNYKWTILYNPTYECFNHINNDCNEDFIINKSNIDNLPGIDGLFLCSVLSPKYFTWDAMGTHMVICDKNFNIVHDPNEEYRNILTYPLSSIIGYNGIINITNIKKKS